MKRPRKYDSQSQLRREGKVQGGRAMLQCERTGCGRWVPRNRMRLGYCPGCWASGTVVLGQDSAEI